MRETVDPCVPLATGTPLDPWDHLEKQQRHPTSHFHPQQTSERHSNSNSREKKIKTIFFEADCHSGAEIFFKQNFCAASDSDNFSPKLEPSRFFGGLNISVLFEYLGLCTVYTLRTFLLVEIEKLCFKSY